ncbi:hypothetical protein RCG24_20595 [Neobacillus sp. OS1-32]|uniref:hypothetical protein n=1 Tax=Neobacillus sp. OS1-32 TaxID=3070682 RepID=UPI0027DF54B7|nr:hypothetical protein [Neobacillus sp. OS1-32]WML30249.1 hypothetical protein RCG24_20595 [Neobacillus sp. OS1-32]
MVECLTLVNEYWGNNYSGSYFERAGEHIFGLVRKAIIRFEVTQTDDGSYNTFFEVVAPHGEVVATEKRYDERYLSKYTALMGTIEQARDRAIMFGAMSLNLTLENGRNVEDYLTYLQAQETRRLKDLETTEGEKECLCS